MAISYHIGISPTAFNADVDFSACTAQYRAVVPASTAGNVKLGNGASNPTPLGVLQNSPSAGKPAVVCLFGPTWGTVRVSTCVVSFGDFLVGASDGLFESHATAAGSALNARWLGANVTTGSANGPIFFFGLAASAMAAS